MARKPKFTTPATAEHWAVAKGAPPRGCGVPITSITRGLVRFWLTASGIPSERAVMLSVAQMSDAWHDTTNAALDRLRRNIPSPPAPTFDTPIQKDTPVIGQDNIFAPRPTPARPDDNAAALDALRRILAPEAPALDETAVLDIVSRNMGHTISAAAATVTEQARVTLAEIVEEARSIVNGAPRTLRIDVAGKVKVLPATARHPMFDALLAMVVAGHEPGGLAVMLVGPAGSGKTTACQQVADALGLAFYTNGALTGAHELTGYQDATGTYHTTAFRQAFEHGGVYLMDEMDRSDPAVVLALNSAIANGFMAFPDKAEPVRAHADFITLVAANTFGRGADRLYVGANQMDGATLDRFAPLAWDYDEALERAITGDDAWVAYVQAARNAASTHKIRHIISPRASMGGANLRRAGLPFDIVADATIWKGLDSEQRARIEKDIPSNVARKAQAPRILPVAAE